MSKTGKVVAGIVLGLSAFLVAEAFLPPGVQPTAKVSLALLRAYQATGSPALQACGVQCRYQPTCSHYAVDAISAYGTLNGLVRTAGRLWRCSPWGGSGYDPAVEPHAAAYLDPQQETPEQKKQREEIERQSREAMEKFQKGMDKLGKDMPKEAAKSMALCGASCIVMILVGLVYLTVKVFIMIWAFKDAKARGDQNAILWPILIFFLTPVIGLVIYLVVRPKGDLGPCGSCHQKKLITLTKCPLCGAEAGAAPKPPAA